MFFLRACQCTRSMVAWKDSAPSASNVSGTGLNPCVLQNEPSARLFVRHPFFFFTRSTIVRALHWASFRTFTASTFPFVEPCPTDHTDRPVPRLVCESTVHSRGRVQERQNGRWRSSVFHPGGIRPIRETPSHSPRSRTPALGSGKREASLLLGKIPGSSPPIDWDRSPTKGVHRLGKPRSLRATTP